MFIYLFIYHTTNNKDVLYQDEPLGGWRLRRNVDGVDKADYRFDQNYVLRAGAKAKVSRIAASAHLLPSQIPQGLGLGLGNRNGTWKTEFPCALQRRRFALIFHLQRTVSVWH